MGATPQRRGRWGCTSPSSPMPIEACRDGGSLPATAKARGSATPPRWPWRNRQSASDLDGRCRVRPTGDFVSGRPRSEPDTHGSASAPACGAQDRPPESRGERQTVKPSIIASEGAVGSAALSSTIRARQPRRLPYAWITLSSRPRMACSIRSISPRIRRPVADALDRPGDRAGAVQLPRTFSARSNSLPPRTTATDSTGRNGRTRSGAPDSGRPTPSCRTSSGSGSSVRGTPSPAISTAAPMSSCPER